MDGKNQHGIVMELHLLTICWNKTTQLKYATTLRKQTLKLYPQQVYRMAMELMPTNLRSLLLSIEQLGGGGSRVS